MSSETTSFGSRRAFLESLLVAACAGGCGEGRLGAAVQGPGRGPKGSTSKAAGDRARRLEGSGMRPKLLAQVREILARPHGLIVCCGPTRPLRMAALYACLGEVDPAGKKVFTVEDPIEYRLDRVTQRAVDAGRGTYAGTLRKALEERPDVVMVGELRDRETADAACRAAAEATGPMVLAGIGAGDTFLALSRLLELVADLDLLAPALTAILAQRSVRLLCDACKEPYKPAPEFIKKANLPADKIDVFYRRPQRPRTDCRRCGGTGYDGHAGIFELLVVTEPIRAMIRRGPRLEEIKGEARKDGLIYLAEDGLRLVIRGRTSIEALLQALKEGEK